MYYVYITESYKGYNYWRAFDHRITALLFAKINGYKLIAKGK